MHTSADNIREALTKQLYSAVKWTETIQEMQKLGINCIFECGPGKILSGLNKRIVSDIVVESLGLPANLDQALSYCLT
jgi:[acyl-carrier-protein] S-malonyltransferase